MMMPAWLPHIVKVDGLWEEVLSRLYCIFTMDFIEVQRTFEGREVDCDERKLDEKYEEGFWHLISRTDPSSGERFPDFRRAERLPWCGPTITNSTDKAVKVWDYREGSGRMRTYLWLEDWDYVVVLEKRRQRRGEIAFLITAYHVSGASTRRNLQRKYGERLY